MENRLEVSCSAHAHRQIVFTQPDTHIHAHTHTLNSLFVFALLLFCLPIDLKIAATTITAATWPSNAENIALNLLLHLPPHPSTFYQPPSADATAFSHALFACP